MEKPERAIALQFRNTDAFTKALQILWGLRKAEPNLRFALPPAQNTFIIPQKYCPHFEGLEPIIQKVRSTTDLPDGEVAQLREEYFWPRE